MSDCALGALLNLCGHTLMLVSDGWAVMGVLGPLWKCLCR